MNFSEWVLLNFDVRIAKLKEYLGSGEKRSLEFPDPDKVREHVSNDSGLGAAQIDELLAELNVAEEAYKLSIEVAERSNGNGSGDSKEILLQEKPRWRFIRENAPLLFMAVIVILAIIVLATILWPGSGLLKSLGQTEVARGLITFVFAFGVIFVTLILLIALFGSSDEHIGDKFDKAKELFTAMIAVFGTILGFYFGQAESDNNRNEGSSIAEIIPSRENSVLLGIAKLGIDISSLSLDEDEVDAIETILNAEAESDEKIRQIQSIITE